MCITSVIALLLCIERFSHRTIYAASFSLHPLPWLLCLRSTTLASYISSRLNIKLILSALLSISLSLYQFASLRQRRVIPYFITVLLVAVHYLIIVYTGADSARLLYQSVSVGYFAILLHLHHSQRYFAILLPLA